MCQLSFFRIFKPVAPQKEIVVNSKIRFFEDGNTMSEYIKSSEISQMGTTFSWIFLKNYQRWESVFSGFIDQLSLKKKYCLNPRLDSKRNIS
jgi:hypothetical protein